MGSVWCLLHTASKVQKPRFLGPTYLDQLLGIPPVHSPAKDPPGSDEQTAPSITLEPSPTTQAAQSNTSKRRTPLPRKLRSSLVAEMPKRKVGEGVQKYYAVRFGKTPGVYRSWSDCQEQITGFRGAICMSQSSSPLAYHPSSPR